MTKFSLRAATAAIFLGTAAVATAGALTITTAQAATVRPEVGKALQEAVSLAKDGKGSAALAQVRKAEGVSKLTSDERKAIAQTKDYIAAKTGSGSADSAAGAKAKFAADYNARRYSQVINEDAALLKKYGVFDSQSQLIVAQAYYLTGNYAGAIRYLRQSGLNTQQKLELMLSAAYKGGDNDARREALEQLVLRYNKPEYWKDLIRAAEHTKGLSDHQTFDLLRLRLLTNTMQGANDYSLAAQLALQLKLPAEAKSIMEKGFAAKVLTGERSIRLSKLVNAQATKDAGALAGEQKRAMASPTGDALVAYGEDLLGYDRAKDAVAAIQAGIKKGVKDKDAAQMVLGQAHLAAGDKSAALHAFNAVKTDKNTKMVAHIWSIYARTH